MTIKTGTKYGQYEVTAPLGKGGMGEVCLAEDTRLNRKVALKLLPSEFTQDSERLRRFELEAKTASGLNHPNIITIYDIGQAHNTHFIATEFIEGKTLRDRLRQPLSLNESLDIALQIANALAAAHEAQIIHRDIKPENVMLRGDGIVKVLDFGLAKLIEGKSEREKLGEDDPTLALAPPAVASHSTELGTVMGTASYMSPEQARGQRVDARTDIFSLGVVLSEMLAGKRPFDGVNMIDVLGAIMHETPAPLPDAPDEVNRIVTKALQKDRDHRYQTTQELVRDLKELKEELAYQARALGAQASRLPLASEAMPTSVASGNPEEETISSPNKRAALHALAAGKMRALPVMALLALALIAVGAFFYTRNKTAALTDKDTILLADFTNTTGDSVFDGTLKQALAVHLGQSPFLNLFADERVRETLRLMNKSPDERITPTVGREICQRQGLKALLTGTIASLGRNYVINLEAVNGQTGDVLAREQGEAEGKEQVLRTLGEAATRLREKLGESLSSIQKFDAPLEQATTSSLDALKTFALGNEQRDLGQFLKSIPFYKRAIELDPNFALAYAKLGLSYYNSGQGSLAKEFAEKAMAMRERVSEREQFHINTSYYSTITLEIDQAIEVLELWKRNYPRDYFPHLNLGFRYLEIGQGEKALQEANEAIRLYPNYANNYQLMGAALINLNRFKEAKDTYEQAFARNQEPSNARYNVFRIAFVQGDHEAMQRQIDWMKGNSREYQTLSWQARTAAFSGQMRQAKQFFNQAFDLTLSRNLEAAAEAVLENALWESVTGKCQRVSADTSKALALSRTWNSLTRGAGILTRCGDISQAQSLTDELAKQNPKNTLVKVIWLPVAHARIAMARGDYARAIQLLQPVSQYESASLFWVPWLRGEAYLKLNQGAEAAAEYQKIIDHRGWDMTSALWPLAHLGLARAAMLQGDTTKARQSYQDFFALWKDADADLPVLIEAKKEYEKLK